MNFKKKILVSTLSLSLMGSIGVNTLFNVNVTDPILPTTEAAFKSFNGKVSATKLNVRTTNSTKGKITGSLKKNSVVTVTASKKDWYKVSYKLSGKTKTGWVSSKYIKKTTATTSSVKVLYKAKVLDTKLVVRKTASSKATSLGTLKKNNTVEVVETKSGWSKIKYSKTYGWVASKSIKKVTTTTSNSGITGAPKANKEYKLKSGSSVYALDLSKANNVKLTSSFKASTKEKEMKALSNAIGAEYRNGAVHLTKISPDSLIPSYDQAVFTSYFYSSGKLLEISYQSQAGLLETEAEYVIKHLLKPYFPNHYKMLAEKYIKKYYYQSADSDDEYVKYGEFYVRLQGGSILIKKTK